MFLNCSKSTTPPPPQLQDREVNYLVNGANSLRRLVRVKIADDNDLETAGIALRTTMKFLRATFAEGEKRGLQGHVFTTLYTNLRDGHTEESFSKKFPFIEGEVEEVEEEVEEEEEEGEGEGEGEGEVEE